MRLQTRSPSQPVSCRFGFKLHEDFVDDLWCDCDVINVCSFSYYSRNVTFQIGF